MKDEAKPGESRKGDELREIVRRGYGEIAKGSGGSCCGPASACGPSPSDDFAVSVGYSGAEVSALPEGSNLGLSYGNPTAIAALRAGEVVLDLGSGGGMDAFLPGPKVGASGRVIGADMTAAMVPRPR